LGILEQFHKSVYLFGASPGTLKLAERNIRATFPQLHVVGRHSANFTKAFLPKIVQAIHKAGPTLLLAGSGVPGGEKWLPLSMKHFKSGLHLWCSDVFYVFAERRPRPPAWMFKRGLEWLFYYPREPWKFLRIFPTFWRMILALWYRIRHL